MNTTSTLNTSLIPLEPVTPRRQETTEEALAHIQAIRIAEKHRSRWAGHNTHGHTVKIPQYVIDALQEALLTPKHDTEIDFYTRVEHVDFSVSQYDSQEGVQVNIDYKNEDEAETTATLVGSRDSLWELYKILGRQLVKTKPNPIAEEKTHDRPANTQPLWISLLTAGMWIVLVTMIIGFLIRA